MVTQAELARRLRLARLNVGLHQQTVASELGLPRPTISQIEAGKRSVSSLELAKLAKLYRRPLASFFGEDFEQALADDPVIILFRATELEPEDRAVVAEFAGLCRAYTELEELLDLDHEVALPDYSEIGEPRDKLQAIRHGEQVAAAERQRLGTGDDPIRDVFALLDSQGVRLFVRPIRESGISGLFLYNRAIGPCILINGAERRSRLAFNAAHEYAHVLLDRRLRAHVSSAGRLLAEPEQRAELLEVRANSFAAAFLLPAAGIERFLGDRGHTRRNRQELDVLDVLYLHRAFGVSYQAAHYRLQNLGWLDRNRRAELPQHQPEVLARVLGLPDECDTDGGGIARYPLRYVYLALEAYRQAKISLGKLAELLGQSLAEARELVWDLGVEQQAMPVPGAVSG